MSALLLGLPILALLAIFGATVRQEKVDSSFAPGSPPPKVRIELSGIPLRPIAALHFLAIAATVRI